MALAGSTLYILGNLMRLKVIIIKERPLSVNASPRSKKKWKSKVAAEAKKLFPRRLNDKDLKIIITYFYLRSCNVDTDNISKPICDALKGIVYSDDSVIMDRNVRRRNISGSYQIKGADPDIVRAIAEGEEFVSIQIKTSNLGVEKI